MHPFAFFTAINPAAWAFGAFALGVKQDLGLLVAAAAVLPALLGTNSASASRHEALRGDRQAQS
jgi:hypothetical protein